MQIAGGLRKRGDDVQVVHIVDLLERSYQVGEGAQDKALAAAG
jgi:hypothetical protein